jgi:N-acetylornithine carbamoyltransferase
MGHDLRIAHPKGFELDSELLAEVKTQAKENGGFVELTNKVEEAFEDMEVVYAKSWGSYHHYGNANQDLRERRIYRDKWIVDEAKMARTSDAIFMHCLPVRRNVIVTDAVIDSANSVVIDEAENRLHVQKAIMSKLIK